MTVDAPVQQRFRGPPLRAYRSHQIEPPNICYIEMHDAFSSSSDANAHPRQWRSQFSFVRDLSGKPTFIGIQRAVRQAVIVQRRTTLIRRALVSIALRRSGPSGGAR